MAVTTLSDHAVALSSGAQESVRRFYEVLLATMKNGPALGESGRYARIAPAVQRLFNLPFMAQLAVGPPWANLTSTQQQQVTAAFGRYISATYADRFDSYSGERLQVIAERPYGSDVIVQTRIVKSDGEPVSVNYLMRQNHEGWQITDVYLDGSVSQLAVERSEFGAILRWQGIEGLIAALNRKADLLSTGVPKAS